MSDDKVVTFEGNKPADLDIDKFADEIFKEDAVILDYLHKAEQREAEAAKPKEEYVFICGDCHCRTFNLYAGGDIRCSFCETPVQVGEAHHSDDVQWRRTIPVLPEDTTKIGDEDDTVVSNNELPDASIARRRTIKTINDWDKDKQLVLVGGYNARGAGYWWFDITTEEQREWVIDKLKGILEYVEQGSIETSHTYELKPTDGQADT